MNLNKAIKITWKTSYIEPMHQRFLASSENSPLYTFPINSARCKSHQEPLIKQPIAFASSSASISSSTESAAERRWRATLQVSNPVHSSAASLRAPSKHNARPPSPAVKVTHPQPKAATALSARWRGDLGPKSHTCVRERQRRIFKIIAKCTLSTEGILSWFVPTWRVGRVRP